MKVKELTKKYKGYRIVCMGYPDSIPYTQLPRELNGLYGKEFEKVLNELEVKGYDVIEKEHTDTDITHLILGGKKRPNPTYKGYVHIYLKSVKR